VLDEEKKKERKLVYEAIYFSIHKRKSDPKRNIRKDYNTCRSRREVV